MMQGARGKIQPSQNRTVSMSRAAPAANAAPAATVSNMASAWLPIKAKKFYRNPSEWPALPVRCEHCQAVKDSGEAPVPLATNGASPVKLETDYLAALSADTKSVYLVLDTNVYIDYHSVLDGILAESYAGCQPILVAPYMVLQELERLKYTKQHLALDVAAATKFICSGLQAPNARIIGQHPRDTNVQLMPVVSADDSILNCALQVKSHADGADVPVVLVSNDYNMQAKASMAKLKSYNLAELGQCEQF